MLPRELNTRNGPFRSVHQYLQDISDNTDVSMSKVLIWVKSLQWYVPDLLLFCGDYLRLDSPA